MRMSGCINRLNSDSKENIGAGSKISTCQCMKKVYHKKWGLIMAQAPKAVLIILFVTTD